MFLGSSLSGNLRYLFNPHSIVVIGVSRTPGKIGYEILRNIIGFGSEGKVYPVNPNVTEIMGLRAYGFESY